MEDGVLTDIGRQQSTLTGQRLQHVPFSAIHHSTWQRAAQTAEIIADFLPDVPVYPSELLTECIPAVPEAHLLSPSQMDFFDGWADQPDVLVDGPNQAAGAIERFTGPTDENRYVLIVSHGNLINWFVSRALEAPASAWMNMMDYHCGLTVILYRSDLPSTLVRYNDVGHLPQPLRGTEYPAELRV
jgi:probable phosphoglycerate mutase